MAEAHAMATRCFVPDHPVVSETCEIWAKGAPSLPAALSDAQWLQP